MTLNVAPPRLRWKGIAPWVLAEAGVGIDAEGLVRLPYRLADGSLYAMRVVAPSGRRWWEPGDGRAPIPFGLERLCSKRLRPYHCLALCEGESDALALREAFAGELLDVLGLPGAHTWRPEFAAYAEGYACVYVLGDGDEAGRDFAWGRAPEPFSGDSWTGPALLPGARVVRMPDGEDVRHLLQEEGRDTLVGLMAEADELAEFEASFT